MKITKDVQNRIIVFAKVIFNENIKVDFYQYHLQISFDKSNINVFTFRDIQIFYKKIENNFNIKFKNKAKDISFCFDENVGCFISFFYNNYDDSFFDDKLFDSQMSSESLMNEV